MIYGPGNDNIVIDINNGDVNVSGGDGIDTINLDYSGSSSYLTHTYYYELANGTERRIYLKASSSITDIEDALATPRLTSHRYDSANLVTDDLTIENQNISGSTRDDLFIHHTGYQSNFNGNDGTDTVELC